MNVYQLARAQFADGTVRMAPPTEHVAWKDVPSPVVELSIPPVASPALVRALLEAHRPSRLTFYGSFPNAPTHGASTLEAILDNPATEGLRSLSLFAFAIGDEGAARLAACPRLTGLERLSLRRGKIGARGLAALTRSAVLARLVGFEIDVGKLSPALVQAICKATFAPGLTELTLHHANDKALSELRGLERLTSLTLSAQDQPSPTLGGKAVALALGRLPGRFRRLDLEVKDSPGTELVAVLAEERFSDLDTLVLLGFQLRAADQAALAAGSIRKLRSLTWSSPTDFVAEGRRFLAANQGLEELRLWVRSFAGAVPVVAQLPLRTLHLQGRWEAGENQGRPGMDAAAVEALATSSTLRLERLDLSDLGLRADDVKSLLASPWAAALRTLDLSSNPLGDEGLAHLGATSLERLEELSLSSVDATTAGVTALLQAPWPQLETLALMYNRIDAAVEPLFLAHPATAHLRYLGLPATLFTDPRLQALTKL